MGFFLSVSIKGWWVCLAKKNCGGKICSIIIITYTVLESCFQVRSIEKSSLCIAPHMYTHYEKNKTKISYRSKWSALEKCFCIFWIMKNFEPRNSISQACDENVSHCLMSGEYNSESLMFDSNKFYLTCATWIWIK